MTQILLTPDQTAERLFVTAGTLAVWRCEGRYPLKFTKLGRKVFYAEDDVNEFIENQKRIQNQ